MRSRRVAALLAVGCLVGACSSASGRGAGDAGAASDATTAPPGLAIVSLSGGRLAAAPGDALPLKVVMRRADGGVEDVPTAQVTWTAPQTLVAGDPDAGPPPGPAPQPGAAPTAFYIANPYRADRTDYPGILFVLDPGTAGQGVVTVTASVTAGGPVAQAGSASASVTVTGAPTGDPDAGAALYGLLQCANCHGPMAQGSPPTAGPDGSVAYMLHGSSFPYPAPALDDRQVDGSPDLAADPAWSAAWLGVAAQGDIDDQGVALRQPMPDWIGKHVGDGGAVGAQEFADLYAYFRTLGP